MTNIILADDHAVVRAGLKALIQSQPDLRVVAEVGDGAAALEQTLALQPDVLMTDLSMPGMSGIALIEQVRKTCPSVRILALTVHEDRAYLRQSFAAGATGYLLKRAAGAELIEALRTVAAGGTWLDPLVAHTDVTAVSPNGGVARLVALSDREEEVLRMVARGFSSAEVGRQLGVSVKSIETYKSRALEKLGLRTRVDIIRYGVVQGWLQEH